MKPEAKKASYYFNCKLNSELYMFHFLLPHRVQPAQITLPHREVENMSQELRVPKTEPEVTEQKHTQSLLLALPNHPLGGYLTQGVERRGKATSKRERPCFTW